jgi:hypothetical protein
MAYLLLLFTKSSYKTHNTPDQLATLTEDKLITLDILKKEDRKQILTALLKAGYGAKAEVLSLIF